MHWGVFLADGDLLDGEITGLGAQRNPVVSKPVVRKPTVSKPTVSKTPNPIIQNGCG